MQEFIAVVKDDYKDIFREKIFVSDNDKLKRYLDDVELCLQSNFMDREKVEGNNYFLQLVAYTFIINPEKQKIFIAKRVNGDSRLNDKYCIGFGGHVNIEDFKIEKNEIPNPILKTAIRELREELNIKNKELALTHIGYVRDLSSKTSEHIGSVYFLITGSASIKEKNSFREGKWVSYEEFKNKYYSKLEEWSKNIFDYIYENPEMVKLFNLEDKKEDVI